MTVLDNITLAPRRVHGVAKAEAEEQARELLARFGLADKAARLPRPALRRPAAAGRHRPRAGHRATADAARRGHLGARPGAGRRGARGHQGAQGRRHDDDPGDARDGFLPRHLRHGVLPGRRGACWRRAHRSRSSPTRSMPVRGTSYGPCWTPGASSGHPRTFVGGGPSGPQPRRAVFVRSPRRGLPGGIPTTTGRFRPLPPKGPPSRDGPSSSTPPKGVSLPRDTSHHRPSQGWGRSRRTHPGRALNAYDGLRSGSARAAQAGPAGCGVGRTRGRRAGRRPSTGRTTPR